MTRCNTSWFEQQIAGWVDFFQDLADAVGVRVGEFMKTADRMICDGHYDSRKIRHEVDETNSRWKHFYDTLTKYKLALIDSLKFYDLHNQVGIGSHAKEFGQ